MTELYKENIQLHTKLIESDKYRRDFLGLAEKVSRKSTEIEDDVTKTEQVVKPMSEDFSVVVAANDPGTGVDDVKRDIKTICAKNLALPRPTDVITTKAGQVIFKLKTKKEALKIRSRFWRE